MHLELLPLFLLLPLILSFLRLIFSHHSNLRSLQKVDGIKSFFPSQFLVDHLGNFNQGRAEIFKSRLLLLTLIAVLEHRHLEVQLR